MRCVGSRSTTFLCKHCFGSDSGHGVKNLCWWLEEQVPRTLLIVGSPQREKSLCKPLPVPDLEAKSNQEGFQVRWK